MTEVRKHQRRTASGKMTTVRKHTRDVGGGQDEAAERARRSWQDRASAPHVSSLAPAAPPQPGCWDEDPGAGGDWWDEDAQPDAPTAAPPIGMSPAMAKLLGCDTPEGLARYERMSALRDSGYTGPIDQDGYRQDVTLPRARARREDPALTALRDEMRDWRALPEPEPGPAEPMTPQMARLLGCDTPEGLAKYERGRAYREAGYTGPLDQDNRIPDPDDPANRRTLELGAAMRKTSTSAAGTGHQKRSSLRDAGYTGPLDHAGNPTSRRELFKARRRAAADMEAAQERFSRARTIPEREAAERDYANAKGKLDALPGPLGGLDD